MQLASVIVATIFAVSAIAAPAPKQHPGSDIQEFVLKTELIDGNKKFDGLFLTAYHIQAGIEDITFTKDQNQAAKAFLNTTAAAIQFNFGVNFPNSLALNYEPYGTWGPVGANTGINPEFKMYFYEGNKLWSLQDEFNGWLVCDWWHQVPQLFWIQAPVESLVVPETCAHVHILSA